MPSYTLFLVLFFFSAPLPHNLPAVFDGAPFTVHGLVNASSAGSATEHEVKLSGVLNGEEVSHCETIHYIQLLAKKIVVYTILDQQCCQHFNTSSSVFFTSQTYSFVSFPPEELSKEADCFFFYNKIEKVAPCMVDTYFKPDKSRN